MKKCILVGLKALLVSYLISGFMLVLISLLLYIMSCSLNIVYIGIVGIYVIANIIGSHILANYVQHKRLLVGIAFAVMYWGILMIISLIFGGGTINMSGNIIKILFTCLCSSIFGSLL